MSLRKVNYDVLDRAKQAFIQASRQTLRFAKKFGFVPDGRLGTSANVFSFDLHPFLKTKSKQIYVTLLPEGLGTADDAKPHDLSNSEARRFWRNIGLKTMSVLTNDAASSGMQTILISLYLPSSTPELIFHENFMNGFLEGFVSGCKKVGCVYFSGETPQLKGKIVEGKLDIAGALFGVVPPKSKPIDSNELREGDHIIFVESSGPHENGFTTLRALAKKLPRGYRTKLPSGQQYWEAINEPGHLYTPLVQNILKAGIQPSNIEPITGHGLQKLMRPKQNFRYVIERMLPVPEIFQFVEKHGKLSTKEMLCIFNYGIGLAIFVHKKNEAEKILQIAKRHRLKAVIAGRVEKSIRREIIIKPLGITLESKKFLLQK